MKELAAILGTLVQYLAEGETLLDPDEEEILRMFRISGINAEKGTEQGR